jgi:hypothetical protein
MLLMPSTVTASPLQKELDSRKIGFLLETLSGVSGIGELVKGAYGSRVLDDLKDRYGELRKKHLAEGASPEEANLLTVAGVKEQAAQSFGMMSRIRNTFWEHLNLLRKEGFAEDKTDLQLVAEAFRVSMSVNRIYYQVESNYLNGMLNGAIDCDLGVNLFIQLGREAGLTLIDINVYHPEPYSVMPVFLPDHMVAGYVPPRATRPSHYIETNQLLSDHLGYRNPEYSRAYYDKIRTEYLKSINNAASEMGGAYYSYSGKMHYTKSNLNDLVLGKIVSFKKTRYARADIKNPGGIYLASQWENTNLFQYRDLEKKLVNNDGVQLGR